MLKEFELLQFNWRGKSILAMESSSSAMLNMWALLNTTGKKMTIIRDKVTEEIICVVQGMGKDEYPKVIDKKDDIEALELTIGGM